jgi:N4-(beta-N-acetylglucosaminyl)-L-asparaginase
MTDRRTTTQWARSQWTQKVAFQEWSQRAEWRSKFAGACGDSPIIGAGLFVDNEAGAATSSGVGEEVIRICGTHTVVEQMRIGRSPEQACHEAVRRVVKRNPSKAKEMQVGFVALSIKARSVRFAVQKDYLFS